MSRASDGRVDPVVLLAGWRRAAAELRHPRSRLRRPTLLAPLAAMPQHQEQEHLDPCAELHGLHCARAFAAPLFWTSIQWLETTVAAGSIW